MSKTSESDFISTYPKAIYLISVAYNPPVALSLVIILLGASVKQHLD